MDIEDLYQQEKAFANRYQDLAFKAEAALVAERQKVAEALIHLLAMKCASGCASWAGTAVPCNCSRGIAIAALRGPQPTVTGGAKGTKAGADLIAAERQRQISVEGWTPEHDATHDDFQMTAAAVCYAEFAANLRYAEHCLEPDNWPWGSEWWKPATQPRDIAEIRNLVKAGALIAAEIDRLMALRGPQPAAPVVADTPVEETPHA